MDLTNIPTPTTTPDTDNDTPPHTHSIRPFSFTNGTSKNHHYHLHHHLYHHQPPPHAAVTYRECLRNHAANMGGQALDGCGEFMPSPTATATDPTSLNCAACGCHRNFHRREVDEGSLFITTTAKTPHFLDFRQPKRSSSSPSPPPPPQVLPPPALAYPPPQMLLTLSTAAHDDQQVPNHHQVATPVTPRELKTAAENLSGRKRFRTKFSQEQKEKMQSFAEKIGWKMQKCDDNLVRNFCNEIGVARGVLKVWMHNNKNTFGRRDISTTTTTVTASVMEEDNDNNTISHHDEEEKSGSHNCNNESGDANLDLVLDHSNTNGSSSSS